MIEMTDNKKIDILGIRVDNYTVRESLLRLDSYLGSTVLNIIETVTMEQLVLSDEFPEIKDCLKQADLCIVGEYEILLAANGAAEQRIREVRNQDFLHELLKRIVRSQKRVFLVAMTNMQIQQMKESFLELVSEFVSVGDFAVEECAEDTDTIVNEINGATPDIVISALASPVEESFILSHKDKIGTSVWYGIRDSYCQGQGKIQVGKTLKKIVLKGRLHHVVSKYEQNKSKDRK